MYRKRTERVEARSRGKSDAAQGNSTREAEVRSRGKSDAAQGNRTSEAEGFKQSRQYIEAVRAARKARYDRADDAEKKRLFGTPREDAKNPKVLARFKAEDDRLAELNRDRLRETVDRELSGQGSVAKFAAKVANEITKPRGKKDGKGAGGTSFAAALVPGLNLQPKKLRELNERAIKDAINLPAQAVPSLYVPAASVVEAAQGRPERGKRFLKDIDESDPIFNLGAAAVEKIKGNDKAAKERLERAGKAASEHPGLTLAEAYGLKGTAGRSGGAVMRSGALGKAAKRAASTVREPARLEGTGLEERRTYSKDVIRKAGEAVREKRRVRRAGSLRAKARDKSGDERADLLRKADRVDPRVMNPEAVARRVDERVAANGDVRRVHRDEAVSAAREATKGAGKGRGVVAVVAQRIARADKDDLRDYVRELEAEFDDLPPAAKRANRELRKNIRAALSDRADLDKVESAAQRYIEIIEPLQKKLVDRGLLHPEQADRAKVMPYAVRNMGAKHERAHWVDADGKRVTEAEVKRVQRNDPTSARQLYARVPARLVGKDGKPLSTAAIREHMRKNGVNEPGFVTQAPNRRGAQNYFVASDRPQGISGERRTGESTRRGTFDADPLVLEEQAARSRGLVDATDGFRGFVTEFGARKADGKLRTFGTRKQALERAKALTLDEDGEPSSATRWRAVRVNPFGGRSEQLADLLERADADSKTMESVAEAIESAMKGEDGDGPWVLVPESAATRLSQHMRTLGAPAGAKALQVVNQAFRRTVLSTSPSWLLGNIIEGTGRATLAKAGPRSYVTGRKVLRKVREQDPDAADQLAVRTVGGGHFSMAQRQSLHRDASQFEDSALEPVARAAGAFWRAPGPKQAAGLWRAYTGLVFDRVNGTIERHIQTAMLGKAVRDSELMDGHTLKLSNAALDDAAKGLTNTNNQVAFGRQIDRMYGKYGKWGPSAKMALAWYTPFAAWMVNAAYFITRTLPRDHPTTLAVIAATEQATEEWRQDNGLDLFMEGGVPGFLQGSIPVGDGQKLRISRHTPFALATDFPGTVKGSVLPQFSSALAALGGEDWKGAKLRVDGREANDLEKGMFAAQALAESTVPFLSVGKRVAQNGPGTLNPYRPVGGSEKPKKLRKVPRNASSRDVIKWPDDNSGGFDLGDSPKRRIVNGFDLTGL